MDAISNPAPARRRDRRGATRQVDAAFAQGRITAPDRFHRIAQIEAATTKGDLAMVLRDLDNRAVGEAGEDDRDQWTSPSAQPGASRLGTGQPRPAGPGTAKVLVVAAVVITVVGVGAVGLLVGVGSTLRAADEVETPRPTTTMTPGPITDPMTRAGWQEVLTEVREQTGTTVVTTASISEMRVSVDAVDGERITSWTFRDGAWESGRSSSRGEWQQTFDLSDLDPADYYQQALDHGDLQESDVRFRSIYVGKRDGDVRVIVDVSPTVGETVSIELDGDGDLLEQ